MRRLFSLRNLFIAIAAILAIAAIAIFAFWQSLKLPTATTFSEIDDQEWHRIDLGEGTISADGSEYYIVAQNNPSNNLVIFFDGGGAVWDAESAADPITTSQILELAVTEDIQGLGTYIDHIMPLAFAAPVGLFDFENENNPFKDWDFVRLPYTTGDLTIGDTITEYQTEDGETITVRHNGIKNTVAALDWIYENIEAPDKIMVAGVSAGGFSSAVWVKSVAAQYPDTPIYQVADAYHTNSEKFPRIANEYWKTDMVERFGLDIAPIPLEAIYMSHLGAPLQNVRYLESQTTADEILVRFYVDLDGRDRNDPAVTEALSSSVKASMSRLLGSGLDYNIYISDYGADPETGKTSHTVMGTPIFFEMTEDGTTYVDWLATNVIDDRPLSIGLDLLNE